MRTAAAGGVPVPEVLEVQRDALVLERIDGPTMLREIERQPWRFVAAYLRGVGERPGPDLLAAAAERRLRDPHLRERELESVRELQRRL